jgi:hypothetical protein
MYMQERMVDGRELRRATRRIVEEAEQWHL